MIFKKSWKSKSFDPAATEPFKLSRSKIDLFLNCPRCFYLDRRLGVKRPEGFPFNLNSAVDKLLKKEFDIHRAREQAHPLMKAYKLKLIPFSHAKLDEWRENFKGVQFLHRSTNFLVTGAVDDLWTDGKGTIFVVDYKATSKTSEVNMDADWQIGYKRQMEVYQWLLRQNGFKVSDTGYFVYCNGTTDRAAFDARLEFDIKIILYTGNASWVDGALADAKECLISDKVPPAAPECEYCSFVEEAGKVGQNDKIPALTKSAAADAGRQMTNVKPSPKLKVKSVKPRRTRLRRQEAKNSTTPAALPF
ncbi:MAG: PD-(D/E)XK nuclease family protein [Patescibacteria group bacterium]